MKTAFDSIGGIRPIVGLDFVPMNKEEIEHTERLVGAVLPSSYRQFLSTHGACGFQEFIEFIPSEKLPPMFDSGTGYLSLLYGSNRHDGYGVDERIQYFTGRIPNHLVPIGDNGMGDQICISIRESGFGAIFYWDMECEPLSDDEYLEDFGVPMPESEKLANIYRVADSFDDFILRLRVSHE